MDMSPKDYLLLLSPLVALLVAILTTVYNIFDRRRHYRLEGKKLLADISATVMKNSSFFDDRYKLCKVLGAKVSQITASAQNACDAIRSAAPMDATTWNAIRERFEVENQRKRLSQILQIIRSKQAVVTPELHRLVTREYFATVRDLLSRCEEILEVPAEKADSACVTELQNIAGQIVGRDDRLKSILHEDLVSTFMGFASASFGPSQR